MLAGIMAGDADHDIGKQAETSEKREETQMEKREPLTRDFVPRFAGCDVEGKSDD